MLMAVTLNNKRSIILIAHNIRSSYNVGALIRTAEGLGVKQIFLSGYTPYPKMVKDKRLPHLANKQDRQISKTSLGAQNYIKWSKVDSVSKTISNLKKEDYQIVGLELSKNSINLNSYRPANKVALIVGNEVNGLSINQLSQCDLSIEIPMLGKKESFNVAQAAAMALYAITYNN